MARFHVGRDGNPHKCTAEPGKCPLGGEHYDSLEKCEAAVEKSNASNNGTRSSSLKKPDIVKMPDNRDPFQVVLPAGDYKVAFTSSDYDITEDDYTDDMRPKSNTLEGYDESKIHAWVKSAGGGFGETHEESDDSIFSGDTPMCRDIRYLDDDDYYDDGWGDDEEDEDSSDEPQYGSSRYVSTDATPYGSMVEMGYSFYREPNSNHLGQTEGSGTVYVIQKSAFDEMKKAGILTDGEVEDYHSDGSAVKMEDLMTRYGWKGVNNGF